MSDGSHREVAAPGSAAFLDVRLQRSAFGELNGAPAAADRDVLAQPGVTHAIVMLGTNDLRNRNARPEEEVTAEQMIVGLKQMALRAEAGGIQLLGATLTPFGNETFLPGAWNPTREGHRAAVNTWIREGGAFDGVVDFDEALRDPEHPTQMLPKYDCDDGLHPSDLGYRRMGDAIDLALFG